MTPRQEAAWLARQRPATRWDRKGNERPLIVRAATRGELDAAMALYLRKPRTYPRSAGWFDDVAYARCVATAMRKGE